MATRMEYDVLREIASHCLGIFSRVLEPNDLEGKKDKEILIKIYSQILNSIDYKFIDYENVKNELIRIRDKYIHKPYTKEFVYLRKEAMEELELNQKNIQHSDRKEKKCTE